MYLSPFRVEGLAALVLGLLVFLNDLRWSRALPPLAGPDEDAHLELAMFIRDRGRLPVAPGNGRPGDGGWGSWGFTDKAALPLFANGLQAAFLRGARALGFRDELAAARLPSALAGGACAVLAFLTLALLFPDHPFVRWGGTLALALNPQFTFASSYVAQDIVAAAFAGALQFFAARGAVLGWDRRTLGGLGLAAGACALTKLNAYPLFPAAAALFLLTCRRTGERDGVPAAAGGRSFSGRAGRALLPAAIFLVLTGPYYVRNGLLYGDPTGYRAYVAEHFRIMEPLDPAHPTLRSQGYTALSTIARTNFTWALLYSSWGVFGKFEFALEERLLVGILGVHLVLAALILGALPRLSRLSAGARAFLACFGLSWLLAFYLAVRFSVDVDWNPQGRYLFPCFVPFLALLLLPAGLLLGRGRAAWAAVLVLGAALLALNLHAYGRVAREYRKGQPGANRTAILSTIPVDEGLDLLSPRPSPRRAPLPPRGEGG